MSTMNDHILRMSSCYLPACDLGRWRFFEQDGTGMMKLFVAAFASATTAAAAAAAELNLVAGCSNPGGLVLWPILTAR